MRAEVKVRVKFGGSLYNFFDGRNVGNLYGIEYRDSEMWVCLTVEFIGVLENGHSTYWPRTFPVNAN